MYNKRIRGAKNWLMVSILLCTSILLVTNEAQAYVCRVEATCPCSLPTNMIEYSPLGLATKVNVAYSSQGSYGEAKWRIYCYGG